MSREERDRRFPEIQVYPQPPSAYKIIEPYVEFAADLEARGEMTSVERERERGEGMRSQTTPHKTRKPQGIAPNNRPNTQTRSPRNVKTAPANTEGLVRDSLQIMKKPQPVVPVETNPKTPFEKAVESLAAMKLHDYAVKRRERMKNRYKLWDEIRGTQREMEISGAEQAILEFSEQLAAWKIKYYVELYRKKVSFGHQDEEKKNLIKQLKFQKKKIQSLQKDLSDQIVLTDEFTAKSKKLEQEKEILETTLDEERDMVSKLKEEIARLEGLNWSLETTLKEQHACIERHQETIQQNQQKYHEEIGMKREELEISRRASQEYSRTCREAELKLEELSQKYKNQVDLCEANHTIKGETQQYEKKIEILLKDITNLNQSLDEMTKLKGEFEREVNTLRNTVNLQSEQMSQLQTNQKQIENERVTLQSEGMNKSIQITSLEKLVTELTVQRDHLRRVAEEGNLTTSHYSSDLNHLQLLIKQKNNEIEQYQRDEAEKKELMASIDSRLHCFRLESDRIGLTAEDFLAQKRQLTEKLNESIVYTQMLESQCNFMRKKELFSHKHPSQTSPMTAPAAPARASSPAANYMTSQSITGLEINIPRTISNDMSLVDESLTETLRTVPLPLEGKLVTLLSLLEEKLTQLDSVVRQVEFQGSSQISESSHDTNWEELCSRLEEQLQEETVRFDELKLQLTETRESIKFEQAEKDKLVGMLQKLPNDKQQRKTQIVAHIDQIQLELQNKLLVAQNIATEALNCKLECDRLRDELSHVEMALVEARRQRPTSRSSARSGIRRAPSVEGRVPPRTVPEHTELIQEDSNDDAGFLTPMGGNSSYLTPNEGNSTYTSESPISRQNSLRLQSKSKADDPQHIPSRPKAKKQFSELEQDTMGFRSPLRLSRKVSEPLAPQTITGGEIYQFQTENESSIGGNGDFSGSVELKSEPGSPTSTVSEMKSGNQTYFSQVRLNPISSDQSLSKIASPHDLLRAIHSKLLVHQQQLSELIQRKEDSRLEIEKWTIFFLREHGRVPGLAECKYGPHNHVFETFNRIQHEIYSCHSAVQELFDHMDTKRSEVIRKDPSLSSVLSELDDLFLDPLLSQHEGEEYEDAYKLHFESVEALLLQGNTDSEEVSIQSHYSATSGIFPTGIMDYDSLSPVAKKDVLENIENDIKEFQQDITELRTALQESRELAEELNQRAKHYKKEIRLWQTNYQKAHGVEPSQETKACEIPELYSTCHATQMSLEDELEKMKTYALISTAKSTEIDRLKIILRKFLRKSPPEMASQYSAMGSAQNSSASLLSSQTLFQSVCDRINQSGERPNSLERQTSNPSSLSSNISKTTGQKNGVVPMSGSESLVDHQQAILKLNEELDLLRSYFAQADEDLVELKTRKSEIKQLFKEWEEDFIRVEKRKPTSQERRSLMEELYEEYQAIQEEIAELLEQREKGIKMKENLENLLEIRLKELSKSVSRLGSGSQQSSISSFD